MKNFELLEIDYCTAAAFNACVHRHLPTAPPRYQIRACFGIYWKSDLRAIAMCGNTVAPSLTHSYFEVRRVASDGLYGACSTLYGACRLYAMEHNRGLVTYTLDSESGASLRASGARYDGIRKSGRDTRDGRANLTSHIMKVRWILLYPPASPAEAPAATD